LKLVCNVNRNINKSENSQDYAQKPQQNCIFMNLASEIKSWWWSGRGVRCVWRWREKGDEERKS
jgi:hypothetical protein